MGIGDDREVGARQHGSKKRLAGAPAFPTSLIHLKIGIAKIVSPVKFIDLRNTAGLGGVSPGVEDLPVDSALFNAKFAPGPMKRVGTVLVILRALENR